MSSRRPEVQAVAGGTLEADTAAGSSNGEAPPITTADRAGATEPRRGAADTGSPAAETSAPSAAVERDAMPAQPGAAAVTVSPLPPLLYEPRVRAALEEDLGRAGDLTTDAVVPSGVTARAHVVARAAGRIAGLGVAASAFRLLDPSLEVEEVARDGADAEAGAVLLVVSGEARSILTAERVALNFLGHLCGVATATRDVARAVAAANPRARVVETRKTIPGLRALQKYAVRCGGGANHRFGLDDAVLIKDNHVALAARAGAESGTGVAAAIRAARARAGHLVKVEVEVDTLEQLDEALAEGVDAVLLDNMPPATLRRAVELVAGRAVTEASGGITPETAPAIAASGVDLLSIGWLTHSVKNLDVALDVVG